MISIFITSRVKDNVNSNIKILTNSLIKYSTSIDNFELLIKYDLDDDLAHKDVDFLKSTGLNFKYFFGEKNRGYIDIHKGYNSLIPLASSNSILFTCFADDFQIFLNNWDSKLINFVKKINSEYFIIHQRPHPPTSRPSFFKMKYYPFYDINKLSDLYIIDECPMWSPKFIKTIGSFGGVSFTDAYTLYVENILSNKYKMNMTYFTKKKIINRNVNKDIDSEITPRWTTDRKNNFDYMNSDEFKDNTEFEIKKIILALNKNLFFFYKSRYLFYTMMIYIDQTLLKIIYFKNKLIIFLINILKKYYDKN
jgi:hypothetical protein